MKKQNEVPESELEIGTGSIARITLSVPAIVTCEVPKGTKRSLNVAAIPDGYRNKIMDMILSRGLKISLDNPYSTTEGNAGEKTVALMKRLGELQDGTFTPGGGGGGPRSDSRTDAWQEWLRRNGEKVPTVKATREWQLSRCAAALIADGVAKDKAVAEAEECLGEWLDYMEDQNPALKALVENYAKLGAEPMAVEPGGFKRKAK